MTRFPCHTTVRTVPCTAVRWVELPADYQSLKADGVEVSVWQCLSKSYALAQVPGTSISTAIANRERLTHLRSGNPRHIPVAAENAAPTLALGKTLVWIPQLPNIHRLKRRNIVSIAGTPCPKETTRGGSEGRNGNCA